jgi:hypothetical protein
MEIKMLKLTTFQAADLEDLIGKSLYSELRHWIQEEQEEEITNREVKLIASVIISPNKIIDTSSLLKNTEYNNQADYKADCEHLANKGLLIRTLYGDFTLACNVDLI